MKAAIFENGEIRVGSLPDPVPTEAGQVLVRTRRCALCASDAHFIHSCQEIVSASQEFGGPYAAIDLARPIVMGHEFVGEIVDYGPGSKRLVKPGRRITALPMMRKGAVHGIVGYQNEYPGGFGELMLLDEDMIVEVPDALDDDRASVIEALAVGIEHARIGEPRKGDIPLVIGCGAIGLGVIASLRANGIGPIVAADFNSHRRDLAVAMGADIAVDPREVSPYGELPGLGGKRPNLVYECVGKSGMLRQMIRGVAADTRIVIGGMCLDPEEIYVPEASLKRLKLLFARGDTVDDIRTATRLIADGTVDVGAWLGPGIGLNDVGAALAAMGDPSSPVRTVVDPTRF